MVRKAEAMKTGCRIANRPSLGSYLVRRFLATARIAGAAAFVMFFAGAASAAPARHVHGVVLRVDERAGTVIVRHDAFAGMPAMTMPFRVSPPARVRELQPGAIVDAAVDTTTEPWTLRDVTSKAVQAVAAGPQRNVAPLHEGDAVPDTAFVDQTGKPFRFAQLRGSDVVLAFVYTRCQDARMCPLISAKFHALQSTSRRRLHLVEVTLDPTYDRPPVLARYAKTFGADPARWTLAVGDADQTLDFAARFGIATFPDPNAGIVHTENTVLIAPDGTIARTIADPSWSPDEIVADIDAGRANASTPLAALRRLTRSLEQFGGLRALVIAGLVLSAIVYLARRLYRALFVRSA
jgi:protein SCO1/2